ncbi:hypothetical protein BH23GEM9_BH23GEM9_28690 [soil metagenome]
MTITTVVVPPAAAPGLGRLPGGLTQLPAEIRPDRKLLHYYALQSLLAGPFFFFVLAPLYFRFRSLRYEIDDEGISMRWGILFRREVTLAYARIQDIHLTSNVVERWLGLARIQVQTASGNASAEMTVEGIPGVDVMRDFLYARMRGAREHSPPQSPSHATAGDAIPAAMTGDAVPRTTTGASMPRTTTGSSMPRATATDSASLDELTAVLYDVAAELRALRLGHQLPVDAAGPMADGPASSTGRADAAADGPASLTGRADAAASPDDAGTAEVRDG